jgi:hypothetical protein
MAYLRIVVCVDSMLYCVRGLRGNSERTRAVEPTRKLTRPKKWRQDRKLQLWALMGVLYKAEREESDVTIN